MKRKSRFWTFVFSMVPGAGHMYLGLLKQGTQLMILFFLAIFLADWMRMGIIAVFAPIVWFFSFFDAMNKGAMEQLPEDNSLFSSWFESEGTWLRDKGKFIGYTLIVIGSFMLVERIMLPELERLFEFRVREYLQTAVIALLFIAGGVKLVSGTKQTKSLKNEDEKI